MEKRKVFKISIIDKEISRTEFDRNTFYTSDSELSLVFKLIEKDYSYEHGEILLFNENDNSFVTRKITKQDNDFVYELDLDIIPHFGKWQAQLQLVNDGDVYTSKPFNFSIVNDLSNLAPQPTLTDINNWATLKQSANELIDEMQDIIVGVEQAEIKRASQESVRQQAESQRVNQENIRQQAESQRVNQENIRQQAESERENNEKKRRIAEFERVDNENTRQQSESERLSSELIRVENEKQRKIDHENRSAELASKANRKQEEWKTLPLINGWSSESTYWGYDVKFFKDTIGIVHIDGYVDGSNSTNGTLGYMPVGYRPSRRISAAFTTGTSRVEINSNGRVVVSPSGSSGVFNASFLAEL